MKNNNTRTVYGQLCAKMGFSFVELIIVISIIALISVIGLSINTNYTERSKNSKITSDISTIKNSIEAYKSETKTLPYPKGNQKYFDNAANYIHYDDVNAFGVYGNITEDTIPKKYMNYTPIDPRTNQYYAYGKTLTGTLAFEIAGVNKNNGNFEAKVVGDYSGETGPYNLIREYNGPDFVYDKSTNNFPYNPEERIVKAKIGSFSGIVMVNSGTIDKTWTDNNELVSGDTIYVSAGGEAQIYYSDGSKSYLGDSSNNSRLVLANMRYEGENNLFTKIQLALDYGTIWTKTSKLDANSDFEIYTTDTEAAVRGTVFGVEKKSWESYVFVNTGSVEIHKITFGTTFNTIENQIKSNETVPTQSFNYGPSTVNSVNLTTGGLRIGTSVSPYGPIPTPTLPDQEGIRNVIPLLHSVIFGEIDLAFPKTFSGANKLIKLDGNYITASGTWINSNPNVTILKLKGVTKGLVTVCLLQENCTKPIMVDNKMVYHRLCGKPGEYFYGDAGCTRGDTELSKSGYTLVAYAPYDKPGDYGMYTYTGRTLTINSGGIINNITPFDNICNGYVNISKSFCEYTDLNNNITKGIYIDNWGNNDYIKYTNIDSLNLGPNFAVEMSVRGGALKRKIPSISYYLFNSSYYSLYMYNPGINEKIKLSEGISFINREINDFNIGSLNENDYYNVLFKKYSGSGSLKINGITFTGTFDPIKNLGNYIYIGSTGVINQFNDLIDYVKIYKK